MIKKLRYIIGNNKLELFFLFLFVIFTSVIFAIVNPLLIKYLLDLGVKQKNFRLFLTLAIVSIAIGTVLRLSKYIVDLRYKILKNKLIKQHVSYLFQKFFRTPYSEIKEKETGYYSSLIFEEPKTVVNMTIETILNYAEFLVLFVSSLGLSLYLSWRITIILFIIFPFFIFLSNFFSSKLSGVANEEKTAEANFREQLQSTLLSFKIINIFNLHHKIQILNKKSLDSFLKVSFKRLKIESLFKTLGQIIASYQESIILIATAYEVIEGRMTFGGLMAYMQSFGMCANSIGNLIQNHVTFAKLAGYIERLQIFDNMNIKNQNSSTVYKDSSPINLENVSFKYKENEELIIKDFSYKFDTGKTYLVHGSNGCGKSTLINIMAGFLNPTSGIIQTNNISQISINFFPFNFIPGTLKDNVDYETLNSNEKERFHSLSQLLEISEYNDKKINELSAGQKQKSAVIMTLMKSAEIYIFDEPTANLDNQFRKIIIQTILKETKGKTLICILHDYDEYISDFDNLLKLNYQETK